MVNKSVADNDYPPLLLMDLIQLGKYPEAFKLSIDLYLKNPDLKYLDLCLWLLKKSNGEIHLSELNINDLNSVISYYLKGIYLRLQCDDRYVNVNYIYDINYMINRDIEPRITQLRLPLFVLTSFGKFITIEQSKCMFEEAIDRSLYVLPEFEHDKYYNDINGFLISFDPLKILKGEESILDYFGSKRPPLIDINEGTIKLEKIESNGTFQNAWIKKQDIWWVTFDDKTVPIQHKKGMLYMSYLLKSPFKEYSVLELETLINPVQIEIDSPAIKKIGKNESKELLTKQRKPVQDRRLDPQYNEQTKRQITRLKNKLDYAEKIDDESLADIIREEIADLESWLKKIRNDDIRAKRTPNEIKKIKDKIYNNVRYSIRAINSKHKTLATHLEKSIKIQDTCKYAPNSKIYWDIGL